MLLFLTLDLSPAAPRPAPPSAEQVETVRDVARDLRNGLRDGKGRATVRVSTTQLEQAAGLASRLHGLGWFAARVEDGQLRLTLSRRLLGPVWVNGYARVEPSAAGFPAVGLRLGRLPLGETISGWAIAAAARVLRWRGVNLPPLDQLVRSVRFEGDQAVAAVTFPLRSGFIERLPSLQEAPVDAATTRFVYCKLLRDQARRPVTDLATVVARAFAPLPGPLPVAEQNRARFVAIAMYAVSPAVGRLAGGAQNVVDQCSGRGPDPTLVGRIDLAKHWALSAALAVSLGEEVGRSMGEWKELADSRPQGEGFSFVDLSADRAGLAAAKRAADPAQAEEVAARLRRATEDDLLPLHALALSEGLSEADFVSRYRDTDSARFAAAVARIDQVIADTVGR